MALGTVLGADQGIYKYSPKPKVSQAGREVSHTPAMSGLHHGIHLRMNGSKEGTVMWGEGFSGGAAFTLSLERSS